MAKPYTLTVVKRPRETWLPGEPRWLHIPQLPALPSGFAYDARNSFSMAWPEPLAAGGDLIGKAEVAR
jgi:hypothetical protein